MSTALPEIVDAWRMVTARRSFQGGIPQARLRRLALSLAATEAEVAYNLEFGRDELGIAYVWVRAQTCLTLVCQRSLEAFELPVVIDTHLGLITEEQEEAGLPPGYEPLLTRDGQLRLADVIEDELILALPVVPMKPAQGESETVWTTMEEDAEVTSHPNPFAELEKLKKA